MYPSIQRPYKERAPVETIGTIRRILAELDLSPAEVTAGNPYPGLHSVMLSLLPSQGSVFSNGKGRSVEYCLASAYAEFMERLQNGHLAIFPRTIAASFRDRYGFYYAPDERYLTEAQLRTLPGDAMADLVRYGGAERETFLKLYFARVRANGAPGVVAVPIYDTGHRDVVYLPLNLLLQTTSCNGMAAGNTLPEAIFHGCCELLERWAAAEVFHKRLIPATVPRSYLQRFPEECDIIERIEETGKYKVTVKDFSCGVRIPALGLIIENLFANTYRLNVGCDTSFPIALSRCLTETYQGLESEEAFDRSALPVPKEDPAHFTDDTVASQYQRFCAFRAFTWDGTGTYPSTLFGEQPSYSFAPDVWSPKASYTEEVRWLVAFFHEAGHNVYIRDVSFLGFPSVLVYVPEVSAMGAKNVPSPGLAAPPLAIALDSIEAKALKLKQCSDEDLTAVADVFDRLPRASKLVEILGLELYSSSPWRDVNLAFLLAQIRFRLGQYGMARESIQEFLETRAEPYRYRYYEWVSRYLARRAEGLSHAEAAQHLARDTDWEDAGRLVIEEMADPRQVFRFMKLPNCPDCDQCELQPECTTGGALAIVGQLYPAMLRNRIEQKDLAWVNSCGG